MGLESEPILVTAGLISPVPAALVSLPAAYCDFIE